MARFTRLRVADSDDIVGAIAVALTENIGGAIALNANTAYDLADDSRRRSRGHRPGRRLCRCPPGRWRCSTPGVWTSSSGRTR